MTFLAMTEQLSQIVLIQAAISIPSRPDDAGLFVNGVQR
jgi:hypothetical protein